MDGVMSDETVQTLIDAVNGGVKERKKHIYTFGIAIDHHYKLDEQLEAIHSLGTSRNTTALDYLTQILAVKDVGSSSSSGGAIITHHIYIYPNAPSSLQGILRHEQSDAFDYAGGSIPGAQRSHPDRGKVMHYLDHAIRQLEAVLAEGL